MFRALWLITFKQWRTHYIRVALTTLGISLGVAVFFAIRTGNATLLDSLRATVEKLAGKATLQIAAGESGFSEKVLDTARATPGVQLAEPVIETMVQTSFPDEGALLVLGVDTTGDQQLRDYQFDRTQTQISDPLVFLAQPDSILLSRAFADRHGLKVGDQLALFASDGKKEFTVQGTFKPVGVGEVFGGNVAVMDIYSAQVVFHRGRKFDRIDLMTAPNVPVDVVRQRLRGELPPGVEVDRPEVRGQALENAVTAMRVGILITSFVALLVGVYIILNSFTIAVNQRWKEIGILRAVGVEQGNVSRMFLCEAFLMGVIGSLVGIAGGFVLASAANRVMRGMVAAVYGVVSTAAPARLHLDLCALAFALGIAASMIGAWYPARGAACLDPALALHNIEARHRESVLGWKRIGGGILLIVAGSALVVWTPSRLGLPIQFVFATMVLLGLTIVLPKLVLGSARALRPILNWVGGSEGALAVDAMIQTPRRSSATVGALMVGLMFVFSTASYIQSYRLMIDRWMNQVLNADIFVATSAMLRSTSYHFTEDLSRKVAALPGVSRVENVRFTAIPYRGDTAAVIAIEMDGFLTRSQNAIEGANARTVHDKLTRGEGVLVSRNFALRWGVGVGSQLTLESPTGALERPILGFLDDYRSEKGTIFMDRELYKKYWADDAVDFIDVDLNPGADQLAMKQQIEQLTAGSFHAFVYTNAEFKRWISSLVDQFFTLNYMQLVVAVLIAILGIVNTLLISVSERRREIGIVRAIGGLRSQIRKLVLLEAVAVAIVGVAVGSVAGILNTFFMSHTVSVVLVGYSVPFHFPWQFVLLSLPVVTAVSLAAGWWPARNAASMQVIEAIGYE
ncbi:MAG TPA: FtsX-like permease family protein [Candidatus Acidoferrales bacterium]|jgi:putative ABC transport system permease protein|nr:FtsX-like permease family protein [Candidatus Acidoferrales bacterium]